MRSRLLNFVGGAGGVVYLVTVFNGLGLAPTPDLGAPREEYARLASDAGANRYYISGYLQVIGLLFFIAFATRLWSILRHAEGDSGWLSMAALTGALIFSALHLAAIVALGLVILRAGQGVSAELAAAFGDLKQFLTWLGEGVLALFFAASAVVIIRTGVLARWLGWVAALLALALLITLPMVSSGLPHVPATLGGIWVALASFWLIRRPEPLTSLTADT